VLLTRQNLQVEIPPNTHQRIRGQGECSDGTDQAFSTTYQQPSLLHTYRIIRDRPPIRSRTRFSSSWGVSSWYWYESWVATSICIPSTSKESLQASRAFVSAGILAAMPQQHAENTRELILASSRLSDVDT
jgi:hypothetical protein